MRTFRFTIAEDDPDFLFLLTRILLKRFPTASISTFSNAEDALNHIAESGADILITNHGMGHISGADLARELRLRDSALPILMISGNPENEKEARLSGVTVFLHKSASADQIAETIQELLPPETTDTPD